MPTKFQVGGGLQPVPLERVAAFMRQFAHDLHNDLNALDLAATYITEIIDDESAREELTRQRVTIHHISEALENASLHIQKPVPVRLLLGTRDLLEGLHERSVQLHPVELKSVAWQIESAEGQIEADFEMCCHALAEIFKSILNRRDENGSISFGAFCRDGLLRIAVEAACVEPPEALEQLGIEPFAVVGRRYYGIGLFYAGRVAAAHGGNLKVHHDAARNQLIVELFLPLKMP
jgi:hypothetical protein